MESNDSKYDSKTENLEEINNDISTEEINEKENVEERVDAFESNEISELEVKEMLKS